MTDTEKLLKALIENTEGITVENGVEWGTVYLDNAAPEGWSRHKLAGHLSDLKSKGFYRPTHYTEFGLVKLGV